MHAEQFVASARAAAGPLFERGAGVGQRIEAAMEATWRAAGCNTNLGILLLCAPIAAAVEREGACASVAALRSAIESVLAALDLDDARAAYRAIAQANPGGLAASAGAGRARRSRRWACARRWRWPHRATRSRGSTPAAMPICSMSDSQHCPLGLY